MENSQFIPGIYNYCDTWCERCPFTARCQSFQLQRQEPVTPVTSPANKGEVLVQQLTEALNMTRQYLDKLRAQTGNTDTEGPTEDEKKKLEERAAFRRQQAKNHPAAQLSHQYMRESGVWLASEAQLLEETGQQQLTHVELGIGSQDDAMTLLNGLKDAWEKIKWYRTLIPVKTMSALRILTEPTTDTMLMSYYLGKAKLVLVCIDQSLTAWETVLASYPDKMDEALDALALLTRLRREMETLFPAARAFQRPGLDG
ncbi:hypothetical protein F5984_07905 [Rudanella paleaurantiibacter]|uniref:Uncharacterized protein n=1 Tax=Rudanella paleaurantiibacter TaxID=2614655 RepID=A0A7J5U349_9BACT|nr:hypothetical protein [Rudanella paleaurantiibacter]KAB7732126.1 hypothetical protein F5984_07905 [Rudanella paleaurantiibacter]